MNPYSRFRLISNTATAALLAGTLCALWPVGSALLVAELGTAGPVYQASVAGIVAALVLASLMVSGWAFPALFRLGALRKLVLGKHYVEGTWLMAERGPSGSERLTVLHVRPAREGFSLSGYCLNQESEIESNRMVEYSKLDGPVLTYAYRSLMPDGAGNQARGLSELMFEMHRGAPKAFSGHGEPVGGRRFPVEGLKLTKGSERRRLRKLEQRTEITEKYWGLFFGAAAEAAEDAAPVVTRPDVHRPVIVTAAAPFVDRRSQDSAPEDDGPVISRRRASDWRSEDATPTADRIRARMMLNAEPAAAEEDLEDEGLLLETEADEYDAKFDADDEVMLEADAEEFGDEAEKLDDKEEYETDAEDDEPFDQEDEELELEADADLEEDEEAEYEADAEDDEITGEAVAKDAVTEEEPVHIRQRYARRR